MQEGMVLRKAVVALLLLEVNYGFVIASHLGGLGGLGRSGRLAMICSIVQPLRLLNGS